MLRLKETEPPWLTFTSRDYVCRNFGTVCVCARRDPSSAREVQE